MNEKFIYDTLPSYIIILMPVFLITGPFLSDLGVSLIAIIFIVNSIKNKLFKYYKNVYFKLFLLFWMIIICSSLLSNNTLISLKNSFFYFRFGIFTLCFGICLKKTNCY